MHKKWANDPPPYSLPNSRIERIDGTQVRGGFVGTGARGLLDRPDEDLAVADLGRDVDGISGLVDLIGRHADPDLEFPNEVCCIFGVLVDLRMAFLSAATSNFGYRHALAKLGEGLAHLVQIAIADFICLSPILLLLVF